MRETRRAWACALLCAALLAGWFIPSTSAQDRRRKPVVVSFGEPNIWSLEQAHYLLARMREENLDLRAASLAALDPNETNATRINILKQLLEVSAEFDQGMAVQNKRIERNNEFNDSRRLELTSERDRLRSEALGTQLDINRLEFERKKMDTDGSSQEQKDLKDAELNRRRNDLTAINADITTHNDDITALGAQPGGTPTSPTPSATPFDSTRLPSGLLEKLPADKLEKLFTDAAQDAKLNATTKLDNYVQMQYEIIAKQLTLLRDEVGPGERLVFLELPESIYTTPGDGDEKMAQAWWHVNGYTRTDPLLRLLLELYAVELRWRQILAVPGFARFLKAPFQSSIPDGAACGEYKTYRKKAEEKQSDKRRDDEDEDQSRGSVLRETFVEFQCEYENARTRLFSDLFREARSDFARAQQGGARRTSELVQAIREAVGVKSRGPDDAKRKRRAGEREQERAADADGEIRQGVVFKGKALDSDEVKEMRKNLLCLLSDPDLELDDPNSADPKLVQKAAVRNDRDKGGCGDLEKFDFKKGIEYVHVDGRADRGDADGKDDGVGAGQIESHAVRAVDIIPRQSSLNVNDIQETVKSTALAFAFKFLFGFAGQTNFQRQREQFEQFVHQELYASGFGKGSRDFGWTFGAVPGTKRVAPGVRTTYAVLVVPDDAESLVLSARGCYFPRKSYEPLDFEDTTHLDWNRGNKFRSYNCGDEQNYVIPVPGGGDRADFWVTNIDYRKTEKGKRATVSVRGKNFSTQVGVLVNGVPLTQVVGLAQPLLQARPGTGTNPNGAAPVPAPTPCADGADVCGYVERIDPEQIVFSFTMPAAFEGIPTITLVAPGKAVDINWLPNITVNGVRNTSLDKAEEKLYLFGENPKPPKPPPPPKLTVTDFKVFSVSADNRKALAILTGAEFTPADEVYVNGKPLEEGQYEVVTTVRGEGRRRRVVTTSRKRDEYKEFKSDKLYRLIFNLPPGEQLTVTVWHAGAEPAVSAPVQNPLTPKEEKPPGK
jgi:hypothetical protein